MVKPIVQPKSTLQGSIKKLHINSDRRDKIKLDLNENLMGCSLKVIEALKKVTCDEISMYPEYDIFMNKLASYLNLETNNLMITNGADEALRIIMDTYLDKNDEIIIPIPTFYIFESYSEIIGVKKKLVYYKEDLSFPINRIVEKINKNTKMITIVNPNNPTGTIVERDDIIRILEKATDSIVLVDEAYFQFSTKSCKDLINTYDNLIIVQTFSKGFGLAGVRLGYIISNENVIKNLKKIVLPYEVNGLSIIAGSAAIDDLDFVNHYVNLVKDNKGYLLTELNKIGVRTYPSDANFIIANFGKNLDTVYKKLTEKNILVNNVSELPLLKGCLRIAIGTKNQMETLVNEIKNVLN
jgi:histidinol-phosphate aminotransferase